MAEQKAAAHTHRQHRRQHAVSQLPSAGSHAPRSPLQRLQVLLQPIVCKYVPLGTLHGLPADGARELVHTIKGFTVSLSEWLPNSGSANHIDGPVLTALVQLVALAQRDALELLQYSGPTVLYPSLEQLWQLEHAAVSCIQKIILACGQAGSYERQWRMRCMTSNALVRAQAPQAAAQLVRLLLRRSDPTTAAEPAAGRLLQQQVSDPSGAPGAQDQGASTTAGSWLSSAELHFGLVLSVVMPGAPDSLPAFVRSQLQHARTRAIRALVSSGLAEQLVCFHLRPDMRVSRPCPQQDAQHVQALDRLLEEAVGVYTWLATSADILSATGWMMQGAADDPGQLQLLLRRLLTGPGVQMFAAARMVAALHAADGAGLAGLPDFGLPPPTAAWLDCSGPMRRTDSPMAFMSTAATLLKLGQQEHAGQPPRDEAGLPPGNAYRLGRRALHWAVQEGVPCPAATAPAAAVATAAAPPSPTAAMHEMSAAPGAPTTAPAAAAAAGATASRSLRASPYAACAAHYGLSLAAATAGRISRAAAERQTQQLLPLAVGVLHGAGLAAHSGRQEVVLPPGTGLGDVLCTALATLKGALVVEVWQDVGAGASCMHYAAGPSPFWEAALDAGLLHALRPCLAWMMLEFGRSPHTAVCRARVIRPVHTQALEPLAALLKFGLPFGASFARTAAPSAAWAAAVASLSCAACHSLAVCRGEGWLQLSLTGAVHDVVLRTVLQCTQQQVLQQPVEKLHEAMLLHHTTYLLAQWAPLLSCSTLCSMAEESVMQPFPGAEAEQLMMQVIALAARNCVREKMATSAPLEPSSGGASSSGDNNSGSCTSGGGVDAARAALARAASWRWLLLRGLRALDVLALALQNLARAAGRYPLPRNRTGQLLEAVVLVAHALPDDVQRHVASGRACPDPDPASLARMYREAQHGPPVAPVAEGGPRCAAGFGPCWLRLDRRTVALLHAARQAGAITDVQCRYLAAVLGGQRAHGAAAAAQAEESAAASCRDGGCCALPAPCEVAAPWPTCGNPLCDNIQLHAAGTAPGNDATPATPSLQHTCHRCCALQYCSEHCQRTHWAAYHQYECRQGWWDAC